MRKTYLDNVRWITVVLVVIYHVIYMFNGVTKYGVIGPFCDVQFQDTFLYLVYPWFMLLLFVVSGMAARFELETKAPQDFFRARTRKLLVPSTIGLFVFQWILGYYNLLIAGAFDQMSTVPKPVLYLILAGSGVGPLWYIQMLWIFEVILLLVRKIEKDRLYHICDKTPCIILWLFIFLIYGAAQVLNTPIIVVYRFGIYGAGFFIGYFVMSHDHVMERLEKQWILFTAAGVISGLVFTILCWQKSYPDHEVLDTFCCNVFAWSGTLGVLAFMKKWGGFENGFSRFMIKKSWGLYLFHYLPIAVTAFYLKQIMPGLAPLLVYFLTAVAGFAGAIVLYEIISRIPGLCWCVLGMKGRVKK